MLKGKVIKWIIDLQNEGIDDSIIKKKLKDAGYPKKVTEELFMAAKKKKKLNLIKTFIIISLIVLLGLLSTKILAKYPYCNYLPNEGILIPFKIFIGVKNLNTNVIYGDMLFNDSKYEESIPYFEKGFESKNSNDQKYIYTYYLARSYQRLGNTYLTSYYFNISLDLYYNSLTVMYYIPSNELEHIYYIGLIKQMYLIPYYINKYEKRLGDNGLFVSKIALAKKTLLSNIECVPLAKHFINATHLAQIGNYEKAGIVADYVEDRCTYYSRLVALLP